MQVKKQQLKPDGKMDWFQIGKVVCQACIFLPCLFNLYAEYIMQNVMLDEVNLESWLPWEISIISDTQMTPLLCQKVKNYRVSQWKWEESEKVGLKLNIQKNKIMASGPITS